MKNFLLFLALSSFTCLLTAQEGDIFNALDVYDLQWINNPQISPDGQIIVYQRCGMNIMKDQRECRLWYYNRITETHQKLTSSDKPESAVQWSPDGERLVFTSSTDEGSEMYMLWWKTKTISRISQLEHSPTNFTWSPDGDYIAFQMFTPEKELKLYSEPKKPKGAEWAAPPRITTRLKHEADGRGYVKAGQYQLYLMSSEGSAPRQLTHENKPHSGPLAFSNDGDYVYFTSKDNENWQYNFRESNIYKVRLADQSIEKLTDIAGPAHLPTVSPRGDRIAFLAYEDNHQAYQNFHIYTMKSDGSDVKRIPLNRDVSPQSLEWSPDGKTLYFMHDDHGDKVLSSTNLSGKTKTILRDIGGTGIARPYTGGSYSQNTNGQIAYTKSSPYSPAELGYHAANVSNQLSDFNGFLLSHKTLGEVEEINYKSSVDGLDIQGWIVKPPHHDASKKYALLVENHGGPIAAYGPSFSPEMQLFASAGYIVFYPNARGSTGYGEEFSNKLYQNYPGEDYQDVMDGVDYLIEKGLTHEDSLYVTGGSAGGIMTAWMIGKNNRFESAAVVKPVMNWFSKTLVADNYFYYANSRYPGQPYENPDIYYKFSPISLVQNIETPTLVMVGLEDLRTPPSEAKQLYHALKLRKVETAYVEIPGASHFIARRPSQMLAKVQIILNWFDRTRNPQLKE